MKGKPEMRNEVRDIQETKTLEQQFALGGALPREADTPILSWCSQGQPAAAPSLGQHVGPSPSLPSQAQASAASGRLTRLSSCLLFCCSTSSLSSNSCWSRFLVKSTSRTARSYFRRHSPPVGWRAEREA